MKYTSKSLIISISAFYLFFCIVGMGFKYGIWGVKFIIAFLTNLFQLIHFTFPPLISWIKDYIVNSAHLIRNIVVWAFS